MTDERRLEGNKSEWTRETNFYCWWQKKGIQQIVFSGERCSGLLFFYASASFSFFCFIHSNTRIQHNENQQQDHSLSALCVRNCLIIQSLKPHSTNVDHLNQCSLKKYLLFHFQFSITISLFSWDLFDYDCICFKLSSSRWTVNIMHSNTSLKCFHIGDIATAASQSVTTTDHVCGSIHQHVICIHCPTFPAATS